MPNINYLVPAETGRGRNRKIANVTKTGRVAWLSVGAKRRKFILQLTYDNGEPSTLVDYASGQIVAKLAAEALQAYAMRGTRPDYRKLAQRRLNDIVATFGETEVLRRMNAAPVVNR
jgi:hypothetical protein